MSRALFEEASDAMLVADDRRVYIDANRAACRMLGLSREEIVGRQADDFTPPELARDIESVWARFLAEGEMRGEYRLVRPDGTSVDCEFSARANVLPGRHLSILRDVGERRRMEASLRESEHRLQIAVEAARLGSWELDLSTGELTCSVGCKANFGVAPDEDLSYARLFELIHPDDREAVSAAVARAVTADERYEAEYRIVTPAGDLRWVRASGKTLVEPDGRAAQMAGVTLDVTAERLAAEERERLLGAEKEAREEAERRLGLTVRLAAAFRELSIALEPAEVMEAVCRAAREIAGSDGSTFVIAEGDRVRYAEENAVAPLWKGQDFPIESCISGWAIQNRTPAVIEDIYADDRIPYDAYRPTFVRSLAMVPVRLPEPVAAIGVYWATPHLASADEVRAVHALAHAADLAFTNARLYEQSALARDQAEQASRLKDEFLATVSHELRTPLNAILGWSRILGTGALDEAKARGAVEAIERNARAQAQLVEDLLDVSRIVSGQMRLSVEQVDLTYVVSAAIDSTRPAATAKGVDLVVDESAADVSCMGDPERLQQIVWNLLSNAVKFTPAGGSVAVRLARQNGDVELRVEDTGRGMTPAFLPFAFDRFRQFDGSTTRVHGGLGLGLSIVRHLVELHGGTVAAQSEGEGLGSTFVVRLPAAAGAADPADVRAGAAERDAPLGGIRVLAVDDDPDTRELLGFVLRQGGAEVRTTESVAEALDEMATFQPHVLVSDIGMPDADGYDLIARVRALESPWARRLATVALTAYARVEDRNRLLAAGFHSYVAKPVDPEELVAAVARLARPSA